MLTTQLKFSIVFLGTFLLAACGDDTVSDGSGADSGTDAERTRDTLIVDLTEDSGNPDAAADTVEEDADTGDSSGDADAEEVEDVVADTGSDPSEGDLSTDPDTASDADSDADSDTDPDASIADADTDLSVPDGGFCPLGCVTEERDPPPSNSRPVAADCNRCRPLNEIFGGGVCDEHADCCEEGRGTNGRCVPGRLAFCSYDECFKDGDCEDDELCACDGNRGGGNACIIAGCHTDDDCAGDLLCSPSLGGCGHYFPPVGYFCHTGGDDCFSDDDCDEGYCRYFETPGPYWACSTLECVG
jgi:hypothetical protein